MTQPPYGPYPGDPNNPQSGQPGQWGPPPQQPGQWSQPPQQPGQWSQPPQQPGQWSQPQPGYPPPGQWGPPETLTPPSKPHGRGKLIAGAAAVIVLAGGGVATYVAFSDSSGKGGAGSPQQAVQKFVGDLNNSDFLGLLDDLAPGEKHALADPVSNEIDQLKRLNVLQSNADPNKVSAVHFSATDLTFSNVTMGVNDHVQIVELTGGKVQVSADATKIPLTKKFVQTFFPGGSLPAGSTSRSVDIAQAIKENGGKPIEIATEKVGGKWYPSLFYTIANYATMSAGLSAPTAADRIPDKGATTADDAVRDLISAVAQQNLTRAIELASPDEMAVLHDYGKLLVDAAGAGGGSAPFTVKDIQFNHTSISGGERLTLKSIDVLAGGDDVKVVVDNGCYSVTVNGQTKKFCASDLLDLVLGQISSAGGQAPQTTPEETTAITHLVDGLANVGIDVSESGGQWYIEPVHTYFDISGSILSGLQGNDLFELIDFFKTLR